ncbi:TetR/AcrR family transcriptional regulator [Sphingomonas suaedae]|uniref:TetR/AcrR family transcriptional regulator n=1 Tax=Sphingomonas suaedae TaxID=2599297 RepID=A0A518RG97_9SPHN|nr:TetR/AcrR family transcriptional regulator [Sphingomonas suaedae]QDX26473.1 TetR/AcrR family transcriptional regulator [Sphingomonas suaedae]
MADLPTPKRRKRSAAQARDEGLIAARALLLDGGPAAVTLANVGKAIGMSHTNVIHHFGSAAGLQTALMESMIRDLADALGDAVSQLHTDAAAPSMLVERVFHAFGEGGAGQLAAWLVLAREYEHLEVIRQAVLDLVDAVKARAPELPDQDSRIPGIVLLIAICAFGDAVIGPHLRQMLGQDGDAAKRLVAQILPLLIVTPSD